MDSAASRRSCQSGDSETRIARLLRIVVVALRMFLRCTDKFNSPLTAFENFGMPMYVPGLSGAGVNRATPWFPYVTRRSSVLMGHSSSVLARISAM